MPLLDGKYEIIREHPLDRRQTLFEATAPDGTAVRVVWFDLQDPDEEEAFERYRQTLRRLRRDGLAAIYDLVSRPGAHYVAWRNDAVNVGSDAGGTDDVARALEQYGLTDDDVDVRRSEDGPRIYGVAFDGTLPAPLERSVDVPAQRPPGRVWPPARSRSRRERTPVPLPDVRMPGWLRPLAPGLVMGVAGIVLLLGSFSLRTNDRLVTIPEFGSANVNAVTATLHSLGVQAVPVAVPSDATAGSVIGIDPREGSLLRPGRTVTVLYALPPGRLAPTEVPDVRGRMYGEELQGMLAERGLELGEVAHVPMNVAAGTVVAQALEPGDVVPEGTPVNVLLSSGPAVERTFLPDLVGLPVATARELVQASGFGGQIQEDTVEGSSEPRGTVVAQSVPPYVPVARDGVALRLTVSAGAAQAETSWSDGAPNLVGLPLEEASLLAMRMGYRVTAEAFVDQRGLPLGIVQQTPAPGVAAGGSISVVVNSPPLQVAQPGVSVQIVEPEPREVAFRWFIEPGIGLQSAEVRAETLSGDEQVVHSELVRGGESVEGSWTTREAGPVTFTLRLNGIPYGEPLRVNP